MSTFKLSVHVDVVQVNLHEVNLAIAKSYADQLGIKESDQLSVDASIKLDEARRQADKAQGRKNAVRPGRGDTGYQVFGKAGEANVEITDYVRALIASGFVPTQGVLRTVPLHDRATGKPTGKNKSVIRIVFERVSEKGIEGLGERLVTFLAGKGAVFLHVWENDVSDTINLVGGLNGEPIQDLVHRDGNYRVERRSSGPASYPAR